MIKNGKISQKEGKKVLEDNRKKTTVIPALQNAEFYLPTPAKKTASADFSKTALFLDLAEEKTQEPESRRETTLAFNAEEQKKAQKRRISQRPIEKSSHFVLWTVIITGALILVLVTLINFFSK